MSSPNEEVCYPTFSPTYEPPHHLMKRKISLPKIEKNIREDIRRSALIRVYNSLYKLWKRKRERSESVDNVRDQESPHQKEDEEWLLEEVSLEDVPTISDSMGAVEQSRRFKKYMNLCDEYLILFAMLECEVYLENESYPIFDSIEEVAGPQIDYPSALVDVAVEKVPKVESQPPLMRHDSDSVSLRSHQSFQQRISLIVNKERNVRDEKRELFVEDQNRIVELAFLLEDSEIIHVIQTLSNQWKKNNEVDEKFKSFFSAKCHEKAICLVKKLFYRSLEMITARSYPDAITDSETTT
jgi:hypothetical protein